MAAASSLERILKVLTHELNDVVEISVRNNGIGIPLEIRDRLFQSFFTTRSTGGGTGLGLSMSYDIVTQQHGGSISVDSGIGITANSRCGYRTTHEAFTLCRSGS
jgi:signal transduction histidine kinase